MPHPSHLEIALRLGAAVLAGALIGLERQWNKHTAGVRTHSLVALGAALFVLFAPLAGTPQEAARMAGQVTTGIGFLGAGVLMRTGLTVHGLNDCRHRLVHGGSWCVMCRRGLLEHSFRNRHGAVG